MAGEFVNSPTGLAWPKNLTGLLVPGAAGAAPTQTTDCRFVVGRIAPVTKPGNYGVFVSIGSRDGTPVIALPLAGDDGQHRYRLGQLVLTDMK